MDCALGQNFSDHFLFFDAGEALVEALEFKGKFFVVNPQAMEDRSV